MKMKKLVLIALALCTVAVHAQRKPKIKGNKEVTTVREELPPFTAIELTDDLEIYLEKASSPGYTIIADDNLIDIFKFDVRDSLTYSGYVFGLIVWDLNVEFFLKFHDKLNGIKGICPKVVGEASFSYYFIFVNA